MRGKLEEQKNGQLTMRTLANQASGAVTSMAWADALALLPSDSGDLAEGIVGASHGLSDA